MTFRLAIVGCGTISNYLHAPAIELSKHCALHAVVDSDLARAEEFASRFGLKAVGTRIEDISARVDAVVLATPPDSKVALAERALALGLDLVCEKPLANSVSECSRIADLGIRYRRTISVFHQFRFWPNRLEIRRMIIEGELSPPISVRIELGQPYSWTSVSGYTVRKEMVSGGVLINAGIHPLDTLIDWFGDPISTDYQDDAVGGLESNARIAAQFDGGIEAKIRISRTCNLKNEIVLSADQFAIMVKNSDPFSFDVRAADGSVRTVQIGEHPRGFLAPAADFYDDFARAVIESREPRVNAIEGSRVINWVESCYRQKSSRSLPEIAPIPGETW